MVDQPEGLLLPFLPARLTDVGQDILAELARQGWARQALGLVAAPRAGDRGHLVSYGNSVPELSIDSVMGPTGPAGIGALVDRALVALISSAATALVVLRSQFGRYVAFSLPS